MSSGERHSGGGGEPEPFWKRLFVPGDFEWQFKMRTGDAEGFFAATEGGQEILNQRCSKLRAHPGRYLAVTPAAKPLIEAIWELALGWDQVKAPDDGVRDLMALSRQWEADLLVMDRASLSFVAGAVCFPSSWSLEKRIGQSIHDVHEVVPRLNPQIGSMIARFLSRLNPGKASRRENWSFTRSAELDYHPALKRRALDETVTLDELSLRLEHQLFLGIPGGVLMGLRVQAVPLRQLAVDPDVWRAVAEKVRTMPEDVAGYKSMAKAVPRILSEMDACSPIDANS